MRRIDSVWDTCPEGEIRRLVIALRDSEQRRTSARFLIALALILVPTTLTILIRYFG